MPNRQCHTANPSSIINPKLLLYFSLSYPVPRTTLPLYYSTTLYGVSSYFDQQTRLKRPSLHPIPRSHCPPSSQVRLSHCSTTGHRPHPHLSSQLASKFARKRDRSAHHWCANYYYILRSAMYSVYIYFIFSPSQTFRRGQKRTDYDLTNWGPTATHARHDTSSSFFTPPVTRFLFDTIATSGTAPSLFLFSFFFSSFLFRNRGWIFVTVASFSIPSHLLRSTRTVIKPHR